MSDVSPNEEFTSSLGVDQSLRITCRPVGAVHNTRGGRLGGRTTSVTYTHHFLVKNTKTHPVSIQLSEQVPLSSDDRVKVQEYWDMWGILGYVENTEICGEYWDMWEILGYVGNTGICGEY